MWGFEYDFWLFCVLRVVLVFLLFCDIGMFEWLLVCGEIRIFVLDGWYIGIL